MTILRKLVIAVVVVVFAVAAVIAIAGFSIPSERSFTNYVDINAPAEQVWQVVTDRDRYTEWQKDLLKVEIIDDATWIEYPKSAPEPLKFSLVSDDRPARMAFAYSMGDSIEGRWEGEIIPTGPEAVRLRTVDSYKSDGWLTKIMMGAFFDLDGFAKDWNNKLKHRVETLKR